MDSGKESPSRLLGLWWNRIVIVIMKSFRRQKWLKIVAKRKGLRKLFQLCSSLIILKGKGRSILFIIVCLIMYFLLRIPTHDGILVDFVVILVVLVVDA
jgi:hypothetical protein